MVPERRDDTASVEAEGVVGPAPGPASPYPLSLPRGGVIEVRLTLAVDGSLGAPQVRRVGVEWRCPGPG